MAEVYYGEDDDTLGISPLGMLLVILSALVGLVFFLSPTSSTYDIGIGGFILLGVILSFDPKLVKMKNEGDLAKTLLLALIGASLVSIMVTLVYTASMSIVQSSMLIVVAIPAITEEPIFRGTVFLRVKQYIGTGPAVLVQAALFSLYHFARNPDATYSFVLFLGGIIFAVVFILSKNLLASILAHEIVNLRPYLMTILFTPYALLAISGALLIIAWRKLNRG